MARITEAEVKEIIDTSITSSLLAFIAAASSIVEDELTGKGLSATRLKEIERYLSAHFVSIKDVSQGQVVSEKIGDAQINYKQFAEARSLNSSRYGQQAMFLDTSGTLASIGKGNSRAQFKVVSPPSNN